MNSIERAKEVVAILKNEIDFEEWAIKFIEKELLIAYEKGKNVILSEKSHTTPLEYTNRSIL